MRNQENRTQKKRGGKANDFISRADVVQLLHVDDSKAYRLLKGLADQKVLEPINKGRYAKYGIGVMCNLTRT